MRFVVVLATLAFSGPALADSVSGRITRHATGEALEGIQLKIWYRFTPYSTREIGAPTTAADGSYMWNGSCPNEPYLRCYISISDARFLNENRTFSAADTDLIADFSLVEPVTVSGSLTIDGEPASKPVGVSIAYWMETDQRWMEPLFKTYQEADGRYVIGHLPPGIPYRLCAGTPSTEASTGAIEQCFNLHDRTSLSTDPDYDPVTLSEGVRRNDVNFELKSGGSISGILHDGYRGIPMARTHVGLTFFDENGTLLTGADGVSDENGRYRVQGLQDGSYYVVASIGGDELIDGKQIYPGIACGDTCVPVARGQRLGISGGSALTAIDFTVHPNIVVKGRVTDASTSRGLGGMAIHSADYSSAISGTDGEYVLYVGGNFRQFKVYTSGSQPYVDQLYPDIPCISLIFLCPPGKWFNLPSGSVIEHVDFALQPGAAITGTIRSAATGLPRSGQVIMYDENFNIVWEGNVDSTNGSYLSGAWFPGTYYLKAKGSGASTDCAFYQGRPCPIGEQTPASVRPTAIVLGGGEIRRNIDFRLDAEVIFRNSFDP